MGLAGRRRERREERETFGRGGSAVRYRMRQKLLSIGDDYWVEDDGGSRVYRIDGKALRLRETLFFEDADGHKLCRIQHRMMHVRETMEIEKPEGGRMALVHKALVTPLRERWKIEIEDGHDLEAHGNVVDHEYEIERDGHKVAEISKRWFRVADTYGVEIAPDENNVLLLAVTAAIDTMSHPGK